MPRIARKYCPDGLFHVMSQGINKDFIFNSTDDLNFYRMLMYKYAKQFKIEIIAYALMNNHVHLLIKAEKIKSLSNYMHIVNQIYAQHYNRTSGHIGHVFRDRYKSELIDTYDYFLNCVAYIHNNPVKAGLCESPADYQYSTYSKYVQNPNLINNVFGLSLSGFIELHSKKIHPDYIDIEKSANKIIEDYLKENNCTLAQIKKDEDSLKLFVFDMIYIKRLSFREIGELLEINRKKLSNMMK